MCNIYPKENPFFYFVRQQGSKGIGHQTIYYFIFNHYKQNYPLLENYKVYKNWTLKKSKSIAPPCLVRNQYSLVCQFLLISDCQSLLVHFYIFCSEPYLQYLIFSYQNIFFCLFCRLILLRGKFPRTIYTEKFKLPVLESFLKRKHQWQSDILPTSVSR